jgi:putative lipoic acid-binding regulatory protein
LIKTAIEEVLQDNRYTLEKSNTSSKGAYISVKIELVVETEDIRNSIFNDLKQHDHIKMVL